MGIKPRRVTDKDLKKAGGVEPFIRQLVKDVASGSMEVREQAAMLIKSLTEQGPLATAVEGGKLKDNGALVAEAGGIAPLVELAGSGTAEAKGFSLTALAHLADGHPEHQRAIVDDGGVSKIAACLKNGDAPTQGAAAAAMASVSQLKSSEAAFVAAGTIGRLVHLLEGGAVHLQVYAASSLANLARDASGQNAIGKAGAVAPLVALLESGKAQEAASLCLERLALDHEPNQAIITEFGGPKKLVALLDVVSVETQAHAAGALAALASGDSTYEQDVIAKVGGIRPLLALVESRHASAQRSAVHALAMLARNNRANQDAIVDFGGLAPLLRIIDNEGGGGAGGAAGAGKGDGGGGGGGGGSTSVQAVQEQAVLALAEISRGNPKNQSGIGSSGAISSLISLLRFSKSSMIEAEVAGAIWALSENHPSNKVVIAAETGCIAALVAQLGMEEPRAKNHASNALNSLAVSVAPRCHSRPPPLTVADLLILSCHRPFDRHLLGASRSLGLSRTPTRLPPSRLSHLLLCSLPVVIICV